MLLGFIFSIWLVGALIVYGMLENRVKDKNSRLKMASKSWVFIGVVLGEIVRIIIEQDRSASCRKALKEIRNIFLGS